MFKQITFAGIALIGSSAIAVGSPLSAQAATPTFTCAYDPNSGKPNPLGMRSLITIKGIEGNTVFVYEQFPSPVAGGPNQRVTIAHKRELTFYGTGLEKARQLMLTVPKYYNELVGYDAAEGFKPVNDVITCRQASAPKGPTIASLPDGNYRYWSGNLGKTNVSDEELLKNGGILFFFSKKGNQITGSYGVIDNFGICLTGTIQDNQLTGRAFQQTPDIPIVSSDDAYKSWDPAGHLQVNQGKKFKNGVGYANAIADLSKFTRINAGNRRPVMSCPTGQN